MFVKDFSEKEKTCFSELLLIMSSIDGDLSMVEMEHLDKYLEEMGLTTLPACIRPIEAIASDLKESEESIRHAVLLELSMLARADQKVEHAESHMLKDLSTKLNIPGKKLAQIDDAAEQLSEAYAAVYEAVK